MTEIDWFGIAGERGKFESIRMKWESIQTCEAEQHWFVCFIDKNLQKTGGERENQWKRESDREKTKVINFQQFEWSEKIYVVFPLQLFDIFRVYFFSAGVEVIAKTEHRKSFVFNDIFSAFKVSGPECGFLQLFHSFSSSFSLNPIRRGKKSSLIY